MGLLESLGLKGGESKTYNVSYLPEQATWLKNLLSMYGETAGEGQPSYTGTRVAPLTTTQQQALNLGDWANYLQAGNLPLFGQTGDALTGLLSGEMGAEPYTQEAINTLFKTAYEAPAKKQWYEFIQPEIREAYSGPGFWSSNRMQEEARGAQELGDWLGEQYGQLTWAADEANKAIEEAKAGRALSAVSPAMSYGMLPTTQATAAIAGRGDLYNLAAMEQQQTQNEINAQINQFLEEQRLTDPESLQILLQLLDMSYSSGYSTTTQPSPFAQAFGGSLGSSFATGATGGLTGGWSGFTEGLAG